MQETKYITVISNRNRIALKISTILYVLMVDKCAEIHVSGGKVYKTRLALSELENSLGDGFIKVHRGCIVSARAIHDITDMVNLSNGEALEYTIRKKKKIIDQLCSQKRNIISNFSIKDIPRTEEEYRKYYAVFDNMPFAFTDIEMLFNEEKRAVDWIFRYGNDMLAKLEKIPLNELIGYSFGSIFPNMDSKWLRAYERATLYGETLEIMDYSPEIDIYLKVICFPTFKGHCGCILFNISDVEYERNSIEDKTALMMCLAK